MVTSTVRRRGNKVLGNTNGGRSCDTLARRPEEARPVGHVLVTTGESIDPVEPAPFISDLELADFHRELDQRWGRPQYELN